jgi:hypothetical protein
MKTVLATVCRAKNCEQGNASLEALLIIFFLILPLFSLVFTMGYLNLRHQKAQSALKLGVDKLIIDRDEGTAAAASALTSEVNQHFFPDPADNATIELNDQTLRYNATGPNTDQSTVDTINNFMAGLAGRSHVGIDVALRDTMGNFADSNIRRKLSLGGGPYTFCELENRDFNPLEAENASDMVSGALFSFIGGAGYVLAPFGGLPPGDNKCQ